MIYDVIIIGAGPAGITAAIYASRKKLKTLLITRDFIGQVGKTGEVANYPGFPDIMGMDLTNKFKQHLNQFELDIKEEPVEKIEKQDLFLVNKHKGRTVIICTGSKPRLLGIKGEQELRGKGLSYCSICDAPFFKDKAVAVIGGGNSGAQAALDALQYAKRVFLFERTGSLKADEVLQDKLKNVEIHLNSEIKEIQGKGKVESILYEEKGKTFQVPIDGVFVEIGYIPNTGFVKGLVKMNKYNEIKIDDDCNTSCKGVFAAGDVTDRRWKQIIVAAGQGCIAALTAHEYLQKHENNR